MAREHAGGEEVEIRLLKNNEDLAGLTSTVLPPVLEVPGISAERKEYLKVQIREHCRNPRLLDPVIQ